MFGKRKPVGRDELKKVLREAILTEKNAMDFYRIAAAKTFNPHARLTFKLLSNEEREHAYSFYQAYPDRDLPSFETLMAAPPDTASSWWQSLQRTSFGDFDEKKALAFAIERESALEEELRNKAETVEDPRVRDVYLSNAEATHHHVEVIRRDYELLVNTRD